MIQFVPQTFESNVIFNFELLQTCTIRYQYYLRIANHTVFADMGLLRTGFVPDFSMDLPRDLLQIDSNCFPEHNAAI